MRFFKLISIVVVLLCVQMKCEKEPKFDGINCTDNCYTLTGKVIDSATREGIANVKLELLFNSSEYTLFGSKKLLVKKTTNQNGEYSIIFDGSTFKDINGYYSMSASHPVYFIHPYEYLTAATFHLDSRDYNKIKDLNFSMFAPGILKVHFKAKHITNFDFLTFSYNYGKSGYGHIINGNRQVDTIINFKTASDIPTHIKWYTMANGVSIEKHDSVVVKKNGVEEYSVEL